MPKHTPGPWMLRPTIKRPETPPRVYNRHDGTTVCTVDTVTNARLIAAAPDLLEACRAIRRCNFLGDLSASLYEEAEWNFEAEHDARLGTAIKLVTEAITKAEGR